MRYSDRASRCSRAGKARLVDFRVVAMIPVSSFKDRSVAVFGMGGSGLVTAQALAAGGAHVVVDDDNAAGRARAESLGLSVRDLKSLDFSSLAALVLSPGVPLTHPAPHWPVQSARAAGVEVIGDIELFCRARRALLPRSPFVAITGTNGKSTTTALIAHLLRVGGRDVQMGGNIGAPILSLEPPRSGRVHVVECSSFQIDLTPTLDPCVGVHLNLTPDHLDRHGTLDAYGAVKERLIAGIPAGGTAVVGVDDPFSRAIAERAAQAGTHVVRLSVTQPLADGIWREGSDLIESAQGVVRFRLSLAGIAALRGVHNAQNAAAAFAAARALGLAPEVIAIGLRRFAGLAHRMEQVGRKGDVLFINDSKATNADAAARALSSFSNIYWIAGGRPKTDGIAALQPYFSTVRRAYLIGEAAQDFSRTLGAELPHEKVGTLEAAVARAARDAEADGHGPAVVLLSPACASYDQFPNFEVRGDAFRSLVQALPGVDQRP